MENNKLKLMIITPIGTPFNEFIESVLINTDNGKLSLYKSYASTIGIIKKGEIKIKGNNKNIEYLISDGFYVISNNLLKIMTSYCYDNTKENIEILNKKYQEIKKDNNEDSNKEISLVKLIQQLKRK